MKINDLLQVHHQQIKSNQSQDAGGKEFARALQEADAKASGAESLNANAAVNQLMAANPVGNILAASMSGPKMQVDSVLSVLDRFSEALADPGKSLKEIDPLVKELEAGASSLEKLSSRLPEGNELKDLVDQTAVLAAVEAMKFNRGDYI